MGQIVVLLSEIFLIAILHMVVSLFVDFEKMPMVHKIFTGACYAGALFLLARFVAINLIPEFGSIFALLR